MTSLVPGQRYWTPHPEQGFVPAVFLSSGGPGNELFFASSDGAELRLPSPQHAASSSSSASGSASSAAVCGAVSGAALDIVSDRQLEGVSDICSLEVVSEAAVLHTLHTRYARFPPQVYTRVARILIAINPFQVHPGLYGATTVREHLLAADASDLEPHIFGVALEAVRGLRAPERRSQALLISGESGAGKTESTKLILSFVSEALSSRAGGGAVGGVGIQDKIMQTNPVLESFGNAMTVRNNNSSRFGKWLQVALDRRTCAIKGCSVTDYLLELTRVCSPGRQERGYHVFFQLLSAKEELAGQGCDLGEPAAYRYLRDSLHIAPNVDDREGFQALKAAFSALGFSEEAQGEIYRATIGILALGNIEFEAEGEGSRLKDEAPLSKAAAALGLGGGEAVALLRRCLLTRLIRAAGDAMETVRSPAQAAQARDSLARLLYGRLFKCLIGRMNAELSDEVCSPEHQFIGVLDIAGFESFEVNSIEQLWINLSNEHLQAFFNNYIFKMELDDCKVEGIDGTAAIPYDDNTDIIALIGSPKVSVLVTLDEEVSVPRATDDTFVGKLVKGFSGHPRFFSPKISGTKRFGVRHFAGAVTYTADGFLEKNVDRPPDEAPSLLMLSSRVILREIGAALSSELEPSGCGGGGGPKLTATPSAAGGRRRPKTVGSAFRASLEALMDTLGKADPSFVRCVKPNTEKAAGRFNAKMVLDQLRCAGVFEAVRIRQTGYALRLPFADFVSRYLCVFPPAAASEARAALRSAGRGPKAANCAKVFTAKLPGALAHLGALAPGDVALGSTKVFVRACAVAMLDRAAELAKAGHAVAIQRAWRGHCIRRRWRACRTILAEAKAWQRANAFYTEPGHRHTAIHKYGSAEAIDAQVGELDRILLKLQRMSLPCPHSGAMQDTRRRMVNESEAVKSIKFAQASIEPIDIENVITRCHSLKIESHPGLEHLMDRVKRLRVQVPLVRGARTAIEEEDLFSMEEVRKQVAREGLAEQPERWLEELGGQAAMAELATAAEGLRARELEDSERRRQMQAPLCRLPAARPDEGSEEAGRRRKSTISGLDQTEHDRILLVLMRAIEVCDAPRLEELLNETIKHGIKRQPVIAEAKAVHAQLVSESSLRGLLAESVEELRGSGAAQDKTVLQRAQNVIRQTERLRAATPSEISISKHALQASLRCRSRATTTGRIFEEMDFDDLLDGAFSRLSDFSGLKPPAVWGGHEAARSSTSGSCMLKHQRFGMKAALTRVPAGLERQCLSAFHNLLGWMHDRPAPEVQRVGLAREVLHTALQDRMLADEICCQLIKQLTENPSPRSEAEGWKLFLDLCEHVCPSASLHEFVHIFLIKRLQERLASGDDKASDMIKQCIANLNAASAAPPPSSTAGAHGSAGHRLDANGTGREDDEMDGEQGLALKVLLIDGSERKVRVPGWRTLTQLGEVLAAELKIHKVSDFAFFQIVDDVENPRLLPDSSVLSRLLASWQRLEDMTQRRSRLLFKRKVLLVNEHLRPGDLYHSMLTYRQAVWDFLRYPFVEDAEAMVEIGACIAFAERKGGFCDAGGGGGGGCAGIGVAEPLTLERFLPKVLLQAGGHAFLAGRLAERLQDLAGRADQAREPGLVSMSRALSAMQGSLRLFGAYFWRSRQLEEVPPEKRCLPGMPEIHLEIRPQGAHSAAAADAPVPDDDAHPLGLADAGSEACAQYWVAVDYFGLRFLQQRCCKQPNKLAAPPSPLPQATPWSAACSVKAPALCDGDDDGGEIFMRSFLFSEGAIERLLCWRACQDIVHFLVSVSLASAERRGDPAAATAAAEALAAAAAASAAAGCNGSVPLTVAIQSPAAVDIAYAVHLMYSLRGISEEISP